MFKGKEYTPYCTLEKLSCTEKDDLPQASAKTTAADIKDSQVGGDLHVESHQDIDQRKTTKNIGQRKTTKDIDQSETTHNNSISLTVLAFVLAVVALVIFGIVFVVFLVSLSSSGESSSQPAVEHPSPETVQVNLEPDYLKPCPCVQNGGERLECFKDRGLFAKEVAKNSDWDPIEHIFDDDPVGTTMVLVPLGKFKMGMGSASSEAQSDEQPVHEQVFNEIFWIDATEVTHTDYESCTRVGRCTTEGIEENQHSPSPTHPVNYVTWYQAAAYCEWRGMRLPTEREWEYAARGPSNNKYPWGNEFDESRLRSGQSLSTGSTATVDSYPDGALNMAGNLWEWTSSLYKDYPYESGDGRELNGNEKSINNHIILRGGSFSDFSANIWSADRYRYRASAEYWHSGFRCVRY